MKYYLITLKDNQQVIASDEDICVEDYFFTGTEVEQCLTSSEADDLSIGKPFKKVIAGFENLPEINFSEVESIPDYVEVMPKRIAEKIYFTNPSQDYFEGYEDGFTVAGLSNQQTAIDFAMYLVSNPPLASSTTTADQTQYFQRLLLEYGSKIFKQFKDRPKIFEIEVEMEEYDEGGFSPEREPSIENNQIKILKILKRL